MKKMTKLFLMIGLFVCLACTLSVFAFAEGETSSDLETPYGMIDQQYEDVTKYPIVVFDSTGKCRGAYLYFAADDHAARPNALSFIANQTDDLSYYVFVRTDFLHSPSYNNLSNIKNNVVVDLNDKVFSYRININAEAKANKTVNITFKNGTLLADNRSADSSKRSFIYIDSRHGTAYNFTTNIVYEDITFALADGSVPTTNGTNPTAWISYETSSTSDNDVATHNSNIVLKNCTFDVRNLAKSINAFSFEDPKNLCNTNVVIEGSSILGEPKYFNFAKDVSNITFKTDMDGEHMTNARPLDAEYPEFIVGMDGKNYAFNEKIDTVTVDEKEYNVFALELVDTAHGTIPSKYFDMEKYPFVVFDVNETKNTTDFPFATNVFQANLKTNDSAVGRARFYGAKEGTYAIYLRRDAITEGGDACYQVGNASRNYILDLNGHELTLDETLFNVQTLNTSYVASTCFTVESGTIITNGNRVIHYEYKSNDMNIKLEFNNVKFDNITRSIVEAPSGTDKKFALDVIFNECAFNVASENSDLYVINLKQYYSSTNNRYLGVTVVNPIVNVQILGGTFNFPHNSSSNMYLDMVNNNRFVYFGKDDNGKSTVVNLTNVTKDPAGAVNTVDGETLHFRKLGTTGNVTSYALNPYGFVATRLNLESDLNMIYSVFLPAGSDATVTFLIDNFITTVEPMGTDENGLYLFKLKGITPAKMNKEISATLMVNDKEYDSCNGITIKKYLDKVKAGYSANEKMMALADSLLVYGAAAQQYVDGNTDGFDDKTVTALGNLTAIDSSENVNTENQTALKYFALTLDGAFTLRAGIVLDNTTDVTLEVTKNGKTTTYTVVDYPAQGGIIAVPAANIYATELGTDITMELKRGEEVIDTLTVDANAYLYRASISTNETLLTLAKAIYAYGVAAKAYVTP